MSPAVVAFALAMLFAQGTDLETARTNHVEPQTLPAGFEGAVHLPADAAMWLSLRLPEIEDAFAFLDLLSGLYPALAANLDAVRGPIDVPVLGSSELSARGVNASIPVLLSLGSLEISARKNQETSVTHGRLVIGVGDEHNFLQFVREVLERMRFEVAIIGADGREQKSARWWSPVRAKAAKLHVRLGAWAATGEAATVRMASETLALIEFAAPRSAPSSTALARKLALQALTRMMTPPRVPPPSLADTLDQGVRLKLLGEGSVSAVVRGAALAQFVAAADCREKLGSGEGAYFTEAALVASLHPFDWRMRAVFAFTPEGRAVFGESGVNDGLADARELARTGLGALSLYTPAAAALGALPRPAIMGPDLHSTLEKLDSCGPWALPVFLARFWPHVAYAELQDAVKRIEGTWLPEITRNLTLSLPTRREPGSKGPHTALLLSVMAEHGTRLAETLERHSDGPAENAAFGSRAPRLYTLLPESGYGYAGCESLPNGRIGLALSPGELGLGWYYSQKQRPAVFGNRVALGAIYANIGRFLQMKAQDLDDAVRGAVRLAASQIGLMGGDITLDRGLLRVELTLSTDDASMGL